MGLTLKPHGGSMKLLMGQCAHFFVQLCQCMSFGLANAPSMFQRLMDNVIRALARWLSSTSKMSTYFDIHITHLEKY